MKREHSSTAVFVVLLSVAISCGEQKDSQPAVVAPPASTIVYEANRCLSHGWLELSLDTEFDPGPEHPLSSILDLAVGPDGGVFAIDGQASAAYRFNEDGTFAGTVASAGDGPGELRRPRKIQVVGDSSLVIAAIGPAVLHRYTLEGEYRESTRLQFGAVDSGVVNVVPDWQIPTAGLTWVGLRHYGAGTAAGDSVPYVVAQVNADGTVGSPVLSTKLPGQANGGAVVFWQPRWNWAAGADRLVGSPGDLARLLIISADGDTVIVIESEVEAIDVDAAMRASLREGYLGVMADRGGSENMIRQARERLAIANRFPRISSIIMTSEGDQFWVRAISEEWNRRWPPQWIYELYDANGQLSGCARMPDSFRPLSIAAGRVFGVMTDELGVPRIRSYAFASD